MHDPVAVRFGMFSLREQYQGFQQSPVHCQGRHVETTAVALVWLRTLGITRQSLGLDLAAVAVHELCVQASCGMISNSVS